MTEIKNLAENISTMTKGFDISQLNFGVYFGFIAKRKDTAEEYLMGGRQMKAIPIAISLVSSQLSAIAIMTIPAETYAFGMHYYWQVLAMIPVLPALIYVIVPVFYKNNISNCYEYLEMRFDRRTRRIVTIAFLMKIFLIIPVYIFMPSLAFSQVSGINIHIINGVVCSVCIFYTMLGGIKAVVWTDVVQAIIMLFSVILVAILATIKVGGVNEVIERAEAGNRLYMSNLSFDITTRATVWNTFLGGIAQWISHIGVHQSCVQRIVSLPTLTQSRKSLTIFAIGFFIIMTWNCLTGVVMYARYYLCDPIEAGIVEKQDKILPFFVQDTIGHLKGMPGIFISCVFSAALSTVSANLNTVAGILYFDYIRRHIKKSDADLKANFYMKLIVVVCGIYCILAGFIVEEFKSIFQIAVTITGMTQGAVAGVFLLGMLVPYATAKGAFYGTIFSMISVGFVAIGTQYQVRNGNLRYNSLPSNIEGCVEEFNVTFNSEHVFKVLHSTKEGITYEGDVFLLFKVSFFWYIFLGCTLVWVFAIPYSLLIKDKKDKKLDLNLMSPVIQKWIPKKLLLKYNEIPMKDGKFGDGE
ncbi:sodium-coupled monocarboxylate transporter 2-like isoform X2 [Condylostylus longicornis]|uniref:sodium-coupled monocarboxylate transporter 2-like isoform X2 n=1 Tax=Condylostylus longicornis TaxID=2530218 RepID=UPI00244DA243|nr:sodium-coupled monocarboxylate transporter 2-like isoform X2 [Condylostylus longicornis]